MQKKHPSKLRFNFGFFLEAPLGTSREYDLSYPAIQLAGGEIEIPFLAGRFQAVRTSEGIYCQGKLETAVDITCMRCLEAASLPLLLALDDIFYYPPEEAPEGEYALGEDGFIDLAPLVRELVILETPRHPICKSDCLGLCAHCGKNLNEGPCACDIENIDPRLEALKLLLEDDPASSD
jgi:uncharacterized protein